MNYKGELLKQAKEILSSVECFGIEDVSVQVYSYEDGTERLTIDIDYNGEKERVSTKDGDVWA